jgi:adenylosuccinate lyase
MIPRYSTTDMSALWTDRARFERWLRVEIACVEAWEERGVVPAGVAQRLWQMLPTLDFDKLASRSLEIEQTTQHDVIAFLSACEELMGADAKYLHFGMTSSDVVDSAFALTLMDAGRLLLTALHELRGSLVARAQQHKHTPCLGRTHGQAAEPTTFGLKLLGFVAELQRNMQRLEDAIAEVSTGKLSGAVGNYGNIPPMIEQRALTRVGLQVEPVATQVVPRDRHAMYFHVLALIGAGIERFAVEVRHLQRHEVKEAFEPFGAGQRGSSAMPHKKNPILSENLTGLARLLRGYAQAAMENVALWHERDIAHSSVERIIGPDATIVLHFALRRMKRLVDGLVVDEAAMLRNLQSMGDAIYSGGVLLALVEKGASRNEAYSWVQRCALPGEGTFLQRATQDPDIALRLTATDLQRLCSLQHHFQHVDSMFDRVLQPAKN